MRILIHDYAGHAFPIGLSRELTQRGYEVVHAFAGGLLTPRGSLARRDDDPPGLQFCEVAMNSNYRRDKYRFTKRRRYERAYGRELSKLIETVQPSVMLSGQTPSEPQWMAVKRCHEQGVPFVSWIQDFYSIAVNKLVSKRSKLLGNLAGAYYSHVDRRCLKYSAHTISISEDFIPILSRYNVPQSKISVVENWGAISEIPRGEKNNEWARQQGLTNCKVFMYSGTLAMKHNPEPLLKLASHYRDDPGVRIVVISEGPGAEFLKVRSEKDGLSNLLVLPFQPFESLPEVLATAEVFLALLEPDAGIFSVPSKILSYLCAGKPTLAAMPQENLAARLLTKYGAGIVVQPGDNEGFLAEATKLLADESGQKNMGNAARSYAESNFEISTVCDKFEQVFRSISNQRPHDYRSDLARNQNTTDSLAKEKRRALSDTSPI